MHTEILLAQYLPLTITMTDVISNKGTIYWTGPTVDKIQRLDNNGNTTSENESKMNYIESEL